MFLHLQGIFGDTHTTKCIWPFKQLNYFNYISKYIAHLYLQVIVVCFFICKYLCCIRLEGDASMSYASIFGALFAVITVMTFRSCQMHWEIKPKFLRNNLKYKWIYMAMIELPTCAWVRSYRRFYFFEISRDKSVWLVMFTISWLFISPDIKGQINTLCTSNFI